MLKVYPHLAPSYSFKASFIQMEGGGLKHLSAKRWTVREYKELKKKHLQAGLAIAWFEFSILSLPLLMRELSSSQKFAKDSWSPYLCILKIVDRPSIECIKTANRFRVAINSHIILRNRFGNFPLRKLQMTLKSVVQLSNCQRCKGYTTVVMQHKCLQGRFVGGSNRSHFNHVSRVGGSFEI